MQLFNLILSVTKKLYAPQIQLSASVNVDNNHIKFVNEFKCVTLQLIGLTVHFLLSIHKVCAFFQTENVTNRKRKPALVNVTPPSNHIAEGPGQLPHQPTGASYLYVCRLTNEKQCRIQFCGPVILYSSNINNC